MQIKAVLKKGLDMKMCDPSLQTSPHTRNICNLLIMKLLLLFFLILISSSCRIKEAPQNDDTHPAVIDITTIIDTVSISLDEETDRCQIVFLETNDLALVGEGSKYTYVTKDYIIIENSSGLLLFNRTGKFLRQLMRKGKGPDEFINLSPGRPNSTDLFFLDNSKDRKRIYQCNFKSKKVTSFPLAHVGNFHDISIKADSTLVVINDVIENNKFQCQIFHQDRKGNELFHRKIGTKVSLKSRMINGAYTIRNYKNESVIATPGCDTLFVFSDDVLKPVALFSNIPIYINGKEYEDFIKLTFCHYNDSAIILRKEQLSITKSRIKPISNEIILYDQNSSQTEIVKSFTLNELGLEIPSQRVNLESELYGMAEFNSLEFIDLLQTAINKRGLQQNIRKRLQLMKERIRINDNPIIIIWNL